MREEGTRHKGKANVVFKILALAYVILTIVFCASIIRMNLLPALYISIFVAIEVVFTLLMAIGIGKKHRTYKINVFCLIVAIAVSLVYGYAINYINATMGFLGNIFTQAIETEEYYIVVKKDSDYNKIDDIKGENVYQFQVEDQVQSEIKDKADITIKEKESLTDLGTSLVNNKIGIIMVSSAQYSILSDEIENFDGNTKIIYTLSHQIKTTSAVADENSKHTIENGVFNVYISGIDTSGKISNVARSDANIVATVNTKTHEVLLTSIPRDYYVTLHSKEAKDKLTHSGIYGINETVSTVEDLLDIDINYYLRVNFTTLIKVIDTLGGVDVYSDYDFTSEGYHFKKGYNHVNGEAALVFSRERHSFESGDNQRIKNQQHVIEAIMKKVLNSTTILTKYTSILNSLEGSFQTNIEQSDISNLVKDQLQNMSSWKINSTSLTGTGANNTTYSMGNQKLYVMIPNTTSVQEAKSKIESIMKK